MFEKILEKLAYQRRIKALLSNAWNMEKQGRPKAASEFLIDATLLRIKARIPFHAANLLYSTPLTPRGNYEDSKSEIIREDVIGKKITTRGAAMRSAIGHGIYHSTSFDFDTVLVSPVIEEIEKLCDSFSINAQFSGDGRGNLNRNTVDLGHTNGNSRSPVIICTLSK